jgi:hypothetical protein
MGLREEFVYKPFGPYTGFDDGTGGLSGTVFGLASKNQGCSGPLHLTN